MERIPGKDDIQNAASRIKIYVHRTPVLTSRSINKIASADLFFKCENFQKVGAFKMRGAINALLSLTPEERQRGVATHSSGNHAQAVAVAAKMVNTQAYIVMPEDAPFVKREAVLGYGAEVIECERSMQSREDTLKEVVRRTGAVFIPPYNDYKIIEGQATCALELIEEVNGLEAIVAPVGGGGLLSGTLLAAKYLSPSTKVYAAEPEKANDAWLSLKNKEITPIDTPSSIADGLLGTLGNLTFPIIEKYVQEILLVSEKEISDALRLIWERMKIVVEPSGAVALAAILKNKDVFKNKTIGVIISGGNIDIERFKFL